MKYIAVADPLHPSVETELLNQSGANDRGTS